MKITKSKDDIVQEEFEHDMPNIMYKHFSLGHGTYAIKVP